MYFEIYEKLKQYAALYPDDINTLTQESIDQMEMKKGKLLIPKAEHTEPVNKKEPD